ncbi:uncharacterized protein LOC115216525, partial [Argonauta hians]
MDSGGRGNDNGRGHPRHYLTPEGKKMDKSPSLHGMHAQSSTETSGLGETITSGFSSQDSVLSGKDLDTNFSTTDVSVIKNLKTHTATETSPSNVGEVARIGRKPNIRQNTTRNKNHAQIPVTNEIEEDMYINQTNFDALFMQSAAENARGDDSGTRMTSSGPPNSQRDHIEEWERGGSMRSSIRSHSSIGSFRSRNGSRKSPRRFLGAGTNSTWMKWSEERRASYRRRIELLDKPKVDTERVTTPIKKARQECLKFVHPDLEKNYLSEDDINDLKRHKQQQYYTYSVIEKSKKGRYPVRTEVHLTVAEWNIVNGFWQHNLFQRTRYVGVAISFFTLILQILCITSNQWISYTRHTIYGKLDVHEGLYTFCLTNRSKSAAGEECKYVLGGKSFHGYIIFNVKIMPQNMCG